MINWRFIKPLVAIATGLFVSAIAAQPAQRLIIKYKAASQLTNQQSNQQSGVQLASSLANRHGLDISHLRQMALKNRHVMKLGKHRSKVAMQSLIALLKRDPNVESVEEDVLMQANLVPNDTFYANQWHYYEATGGMNAQAAWDTHNGSGVVVAIVDTGYTNHSDLVANVLPGYDFIDDTFVSNDGDGRDADASDPGDWYAFNECGFLVPGADSSWHGTHTAGTVAAVTNNGQGVAGVAYGAKILPVRVLGKCGGYLSDIADGIVWASGGSVAGVPANPNPAQVINMSLGGSGACDATYQSAIDTARANGAVVVVSAGNSNDDSAGYRPASCDGVINVAANDRQGNRASYSNFGAIIDVTAPGGETASVGSDGVASTLNSGTTTPSTENYVYYQGTSMAAPHVAGTAALMMQADPSLTPDQVETILKNTARPLPGSCSGGCGAGIIDARAALDAIGGTTNTPPTSSFTFSTADLTVNFTDASSDSDGSVTSWSWNFGDGATSSVQNPNHTYASDGTYTVTLTVTDNSGATDASSQSVTVSQAVVNQPPTSSFTFTTSDLQANFTDTSSDSDGSVIGWSWDFGDSGTSTAQNPSHAYAAAGTYAVTLTVTDNDGATHASTQDVTVTSGAPTTDGFTVTGINIDPKQWSRYTIDVPAGATRLEVNTSGGTGNVNLFVRFGTAPTNRIYDCKDGGGGNNESCVITNPQSGTWHIGVKATKKGAANVQLDAYWFTN